MTNFETDQALTQRCEEVRDAARDALAWQSETTNEAVRSKTGIERALRKTVVQAGKLVDAARRRTCVGVFGASQAGKSFLISALARKGEVRLMATFGDRSIDFIARINPEGGKESTGVVTRFTCKPAGPLPVGHPVQLGLLSETDVVRILANSFAFDLSHGGADEDGEDELDAHVQEIERVLSEVAGRVGAQNHLSAEDVYEVADYTRNYLTGGDKRVPRLDALKRTAYWDEMEELLPVLAVGDRVKLYSVLWESLDIYTQPCRELLEALELLKHKREVFASPESLFIVDGDDWRRSPDKSIVNVSTLNGIGSASDDVVSVVTADGGSAKIKRACLTGLIAELNITIQDQPFDFFDHTDLLDFPGARTRKPVGKDPVVLSDPEIQTEHFLRGKVAYLFQRYCDEHELNAMLLTVGPSNQEVPDLAKMIEDWIEKTHGTPPASRDNIANALFFVFSKFDMAFERGAGKEVSPERWSNRLEASLLKPFGGGHSSKTDWVNNWTEGKPFNNSYWIRNPNLRADALFKYEGNDDKFKEVGFLNDDVKKFMDEMFQAYMQCEEVGRHFADPKGAWDPCLAFNDGGITRLAKSLAPVCRPELKRAQVAQRLKALCHEIEDQVARYYVSGDLETVRREKTEIAKEVLKSLASCWKAEKFGHFMHALKLNENVAVETYMATEREAASIAVKGASSASSQPADSSDILGALGFDDDEVAPEAGAGDAGDSGKAGSAQRDLAEKFADDIEALWLDQVREIAHNESYTSYLGITSETLMKFANEMVNLAHRAGVFAKIVATVREEYNYKISPREVWVWRQVAPACHIFNDFLVHLGTRQSNQHVAVQITNIQDQSVTAFEPTPPVGDSLILEDTPDDYGMKYLLDFLSAAQHQIKGNAEFQIGFVGNAAENARLGAIIKTVSGRQS
jgi:hypothetical protein